jgi:hypothetical protein
VVVGRLVCLVLVVVVIVVDRSSVSGAGVGLGNDCVLPVTLDLRGSAANTLRALVSLDVASLYALFVNLARGRWGQQRCPLRLWLDGAKGVPLADGAHALLLLQPRLDAVVVKIMFAPQRGDDSSMCVRLEADAAVLIRVALGKRALGQLEGLSG